VAQYLLNEVEQPAFLVNELGRGKAVYLNFIPVGYKEAVGDEAEMDQIKIREMKGRSAASFRRMFGKIVELADTEELLSNPLHPYTKALLSAVPVPDPTYHRPEVQIKGGISKGINPIPECRFRPRCPIAQDDICGVNDHPALEEKKPDHFVSCYLVDREFEVVGQE